MSAFTDATEEAILNHLFRGQAWPLPSGVYLGLFTADPGEGAAPSGECDYTGYQRLETSTASWAPPANQSAGTGKETTNSVDLLFPPNGGTTDVSITHAAVFGAATGGDPLMIAPLEEMKTLAPEDALVLYAGELVLGVD